MTNNNGGCLMVSYALIVVLQVLVVIALSRVSLGFVSNGFDELSEMAELSSAQLDSIELITSIKQLAGD